MTPVARAVVAFVLVAGAGPAGFLIYHTVFDKHPLPGRQSGAPTSSPLSSASMRIEMKSLVCINRLLLDWLAGDIKDISCTQVKENRRHRKNRPGGQAAGGAAPEVKILG